MGCWNPETGCCRMLVRNEMGEVENVCDLSDEGNCCILLILRLVRYIA